MTYSTSYEKRTACKSSAPETTWRWSVFCRRKFSSNSSFETPTRQVTMDLRADIRRFVSENFLFGGATDFLKDDESFLDGGIIDSTGILELVGFLEQRY